MSGCSSSGSTPKKYKPKPSSSIPTWRNQSLSKNSSPARLTYVLAEPEHSAPLASAKSKLPLSVLYDEPEGEQQEEVKEDPARSSSGTSTLPRRFPTSNKSFRPAGLARPGRAASECARPAATQSPLLASSRWTTTRAAHPALVSMTVRAPAKRAVTILESPVSVTGLLNMPPSIKGKEKDTSTLEVKEQEREKASQLLNVDSFPSVVVPGSSVVNDDDIPPPCPPSDSIPATTSSPATAHVTSSPSNPATNQDYSSCNANPILVSSVPSGPIIDAEPPGPTASNGTIQSDNSTSTTSETPSSPPPSLSSSSTTAPADRSASGKKEGSWFTTSWFGWSSSAPNFIPTSYPGGTRGNDGDSTSEQRTKSAGKSRDHDIDRQDSGKDSNVNCPENVRESSREDDASQVSQASATFRTQVADRADNASMSITNGDCAGKPSISPSPLTGSTDVEGQNPTPTPASVQTSSQVDKELKSPSTHPGSVVATSATPIAMPTPPDATAVSAQSSTSDSDLTPSASGLTDGGAVISAQDSRGPQTQLGTATQTSSWWDYVGWKSNVPTGAPNGSTSSTTSTTVASSNTGGTLNLGQSLSVQDATGEKKGVPLPCCTPSAPQPPLIPSGSQPKDPNPVLESVPSEECAPQKDQDGEQAQVSQQEEVQVQAQEPKEPQHHGHTRNTAASSWYSPWSWYGSSSQTPAADGHGTSNARAIEESKEHQLKCENVSEPPCPVESREESQGQQAPQVSVTPPEEERPPATADADANATSSNVVAEHNPISATIDSHRSSWLSFFASTASRALITKSITGPPASDPVGGGGGSSSTNVKVDENGMEVMDIDDEVDPPASQVSQALPPPPDSSKQKEGAKDKETKALVTVSSLSPAQGLVASLVRGRGRVRSIQGRADGDKDSLKDGANSDTSSIRSGVVGQGPGTVTPANGIAIPSKHQAESPATSAGSIPSSPASTTVSLVKKASLTLTGTKSSTATIPNGNATTVNTTTTTLNATTAVNTTAANASSEKNNKNNKSKSVSPTPSPTTKKPAPSPPLPNLVLPSWQDTFHTAPRNIVPRRAEAGTLSKTVQYVSEWLFSGGRSGGSSFIGGNSGRRGRETSIGKTPDKGKRKASSVERERVRTFTHFGMALPKAWDVVNSMAQADGTNLVEDVLRGCKRVVVIGVHGWFPGAVMRTVIGEPTGTSSKFANMMAQALEEFENEHGVQFEKITKIPLEGEGTIQRRVERLYSNLLGNKEWMDDLKTADAILVATHSQGSVVSTHLLNRLIVDKHIRTTRNSVVAGPSSSFPAATGMETAPATKVQRVCCLAMCGIHLGPLRYLSTTSLFQPYFQYLESPAARELFEFQNTDSEASKEYVKALGSVLSNGVKMLYAASLNDQVVPIYSGLFTAASHPLILRALYIDGDAYNSSDFLANLLVLLLRILNSGIPDSGLLVHLSEATAGSLNGVGHSAAYEEIGIYSLAVKYLFLTNDGLEEHSDLILDPFNARQEQNDYEIPWALRDVIADERVIHFFSKEIVQLRDAFREWHPRTSILRDLKRKLQPIQRLPASFATSRL